MKTQPSSAAESSSQHQCQVRLTLSPAATQELRTLAAQLDLTIEEAFHSLSELSDLLSASIENAAREAYTQKWWRDAGENAQANNGKFLWQGTAA